MYYLSMAHLFPTFWAMVAHLVNRDLQEPYESTSCIGTLRFSFGSVIKGRRIQISAYDDDEHVKLQYHFVDGEWTNNYYIIHFNNYNPRIVQRHAEVRGFKPDSYESDNNDEECQNEECQNEECQGAIESLYPVRHVPTMNIISPGEIGDYYVEPASGIVFDSITNTAFGHLDRDNTTITPLEPADIMFCHAHNIRVSSLNLSSKMV